MTAASETSPAATAERERFVSVFTLVLWTVCAAVSAIGFSLSYPRPKAGESEPAPLRLAVVHVELNVIKSNELKPVPMKPARAESSFSSAPPPLIATTPPAPMPQLIALAQPVSVTAFTASIETPVRLVELHSSAAASSVQPPASTPAKSETKPGAVPASTAPSIPVQALTYGLGEGRQPAPEYPPAAQRSGQEGTVLVRFSVGLDGNVTEAQTAAPSPWPALNEAALRAVRERWRFPRGPLRQYEVAIRFELKK